MLFAGMELWARQALRVPVWVPSLTIFWIFLQAAWLKRAEPSSRAIYLYVAAIALSVTDNIPALYLAHATLTKSVLQVGISLLEAAAWITSIFVFRSEMRRHFTQADPRGLELSGVMTFFFNTLYFQYWFRQIYREQTEPSLSITSSHA